MINPKYQFDKEYKEKLNTILISGSDEVGRGCIAGPLVVASVILKPEYNNPEINDSKKIPEYRREVLFEEIKQNCLAFSIKEYSSLVVDKLNPRETSLLGMQETIADLQIQPDFCLIDGNYFKSDNYKFKTVIKGDFYSQTIAAASILAKVYRDRICIEYGNQYPKYGFEKHKGYWTKLHKEKTEKYGVLSIHRKSYKPIIDLIERGE